MPRLNKRAVLALLGRKRLLRLAQHFELELESSLTADELTTALARKRSVKLDEVIRQLNAAEIEQLCASFELERSGDKDTDIEVLLAAAGPKPKPKPKPKLKQEPQPQPQELEPQEPETELERAEPEPTPVAAGPEPLFRERVSPTVPDVGSVLQALTHARIAELARDLGVIIPGESSTKAARVHALRQSTALALGDALAWMTRDELKAALRAHGLDDSGRARADLAGRLRTAAGEAQRREPALARDPHVPVVGAVVRVRHRQWLVEAVTPPSHPREATRVELVCLDDDDPGRELEVLWELELGARVMQPEAHGLGTITALDPPRHFAAYLHALEWSSVTATDPKLFQAPFRAGIRLLTHQLAPLKKALELPRANLFVADDVGLGKTIEAGLVMQELLLRQRVDFVLVVCPASVCLQWRDEMQQRFGLHFEIYNRDFVGRRRQERGFAVNPWATHNRFIVSYPILRRPEYRDPLLQHLDRLAASSADGRQGEKARKSLLILDEAHTAAPASASKYAVDSRVTTVIREVTRKFENRLFLSATPHNGHTNSFAALLELLDPQRFTRATRPRPEILRPVMVRRLKSDLPSGDYPERKVVALALEHHDGRWYSTGGERVELGEAAPVELELAAKLRAYARLCKPRNKRGRLVFINLQKRLLSSVEAFWRTLGVHAEAVGKQPERWLPSAQFELPGDDDDEYGEDDESRDQLDAAALATSSRALQSPQGQARELLDEMLELARVARKQPGAKLLALLAWIRAHQCSAVDPSPADEVPERAADRRWTDTRVLIFTEYGDTKRYLIELLGAAVARTDRGSERIMQFHGGMSDEQRDEVQRAFNSPPDEHPVRILICTDAAREGVNLQGHCADLFHFDIPWNPARMEQRNGRIDRTLQASPEVRCHYFVLPQRAEDRVLRTVVGKVNTIRRELGSLGAVVMDQMAEVLEAEGIHDETEARLEQAESFGGRRELVVEELEQQRPSEPARIEAELVELSRMLNASAKLLRFDPALLREAIDVGLELAGAAEGLREDDDERGLFHLPTLPDSWQPTLDTLRPKRGRDEPFWEWRRRPPLPIVFPPPRRLDGSRVHMHLSHPLTQRVLGRFLAQGFGAHDLSRVSVVHNRHDHLARVIAFGRLTLFGPGAVRLHDQLVTISAPWLDDRGEGHLVPFEQAAERNALDMLERVLAERPTLDSVGAKTRERLLQSAAADFAALWPHVDDEAESLAHEARQKLSARGASEAEALRRILETQRADIAAQIDRSQLEIAATFTEAERAQQEQLARDRDYLVERLAKIDHELDTEPVQIRALYEVSLRRLEPVGLVYLWPSTRS
ncbi:MAG: DISARM system SNF2-like helicase DrmD [Enhygromyxa sp.]